MLHVSVCHNVNAAAHQKSGQVPEFCLPAAGYSEGGLASYNLCAGSVLKCPKVLSLSRMKTVDSDVAHFHELKNCPHKCILHMQVIICASVTVH